MTTRELLRQALTALEYHRSQTRPIYQTDLVMTALREELFKPEPEPYGYVSEHNCTGPFKHQFHLTQETIHPDNCKSITPVYLKGTTNV